MYYLGLRDLIARWAERPTRVHSREGHTIAKVIVSSQVHISDTNSLLVSVPGAFLVAKVVSPEFLFAIHQEVAVGAVHRSLESALQPKVLEQIKPD